MKVGISLLDFQPRNSGGIESYVRDLIEGLQRHNYEDEFYIIMNWHNRGEIEVDKDNFDIVYADRRSVSKKLLHKAGLKGHSGRDCILKNVNKLGLDVILYPLQHIPLGLESYGGKFVVSIMDIQHEYFKDFFERQDYKLRHSHYTEACRRATRIISISDFTKKTLIEKYKIEVQKITTIYLNFNPSRVSQKKSRNDYGKYFFYPAATWPHKNHLRLIEAFKNLSNKYPEYKLVLAGIDKQNEAKVENKINKLGLNDVVIRLGYVDDSELAELFTNAFAVTFPSLFEGFGIPVLEAMSVGIPTVIANSTSLPEVGGDATLYFDPTNINDIEAKMIKIILDKKLRTKLVQLGHKQVKKFSLEKMTHETCSLLKEVANG